MSEHDKNDNTPVSRNMAALDLCFILAVGALIAGAFISALTYDFISSRTPIVIMIPLLIMIAIQIKKSYHAGGFGDIAHAFGEMMSGKIGEFNGVAAFFGWLLVLLSLIFLVGHYAGMAIFMFLLLYLVAEEKLGLSLTIAISVTAAIYLLFEQIFSIALDRGLVYQAWTGYSIF